NGGFMKDKLKTCIDWLHSKGTDYADCRFVRCEKESIRASDNHVDTMSRDLDMGVGIRVLVNGAWGFAATAILTAAELKKTANRALQIAKASALTKYEPAILADQEPFVDYYQTGFKIDPFEVSPEKKIGLLLEICGILKKSKKIKTAEASMAFNKIRKIFISTEGAEIEQDILESGAGYNAIAFDGKEAQKRSYPNSFGGDFATRGYEFIEMLGLLDNAERIREEAIALLKAAPCPDTETTVIISGPQMALQVHESCGHPIELDRVLGTEISLAGGSFLTIDKLNKLKYGSDLVNITADATTPGGLGTFGYDDEGVKAQRTPVVKKGRFVGYLTSRETAPVISQRSNGAMRADGWNRLPLIRMTNINLEPGKWELDDLIADTPKGVFFDINKSWSIDDKRLNFQFGGECAWEIKNGKLGRMFKNPVYTGITPKFWNSCDAVCNQKHWHVWGIPNCGKGEPMQTAHVAHGTSPARFRNVKVGVSK
ncbi:MAG: TldD/PmbA family protein, partial [candidate division Zixibacteria bacterium]|nr:TldD/PmbA family protein [candidate division Zixibacteria bacterium]